MCNGLEMAEFKVNRDRNTGRAESVSQFNSQIGRNRDGWRSGVNIDPTISTVVLKSFRLKNIRFRIDLFPGADIPHLEQGYRYLFIVYYNNSTFLAC